MSKNLLQTGILFKPTSLLNENVSDNGKFLVSGVIQRANAKNKNGRVYPKDVLDKQVKQYVKEFIEEGISYGELDHPDSSVVEFKNTSHTLEKVWWDGDNLMGTFEILDTPAGNILKTILKAGKTVGVSSRGLGSVKELDEVSGTLEVQDDFEIICWDFVTNPSTHKAFQRKVSESKLNESTKMVNRKNKYGSVNNAIYDIICNMSGKCEIN